MPACNLTELTALIPCLKCVSEDDLLAMEVMLMSKLLQTSSDPAYLQALGKCLACSSDADLNRMEVQLWNHFQTTIGRGDLYTAQQLSDLSKCLKCLPPHLLRAIRLQLLCQLIGEPLLN